MAAKKRTKVKKRSKPLLSPASPVYVRAHVRATAKLRRRSK